MDSQPLPNKDGYPRVALAFRGTAPTLPIGLGVGTPGKLVVQDAGDFQFPHFLPAARPEAEEPKSRPSASPGM